MRKLIVVLTILVSTIGLIAASPALPAASAANCTPNMTQTTWQANGNWLNYYAYLNGCTDVDMVQIVMDYGGYLPGWWDWSNSSWHPAPSPPSLLEVGCGTQYTTFTGSCGTTYYVHPWCGGLTHTIDTQFIWRIHNKTQQTWGAYHQTDSANYAIVC